MSQRTLPTNPKWLWYAENGPDNRPLTSFGRWRAHYSQSAYLRLDTVDNFANQPSEKPPLEDQVTWWQVGLAALVVIGVVVIGLWWTL